MIYINVFNLSTFLSIRHQHNTRNIMEKSKGYQTARECSNFHMSGRKQALVFFYLLRHCLKSIKNLFRYKNQLKIYFGIKN